MRYNDSLAALSKDGIKSITEHSSDFEKLKVLFVENAEKEVGLLYRGEMFFYATEIATRNFINQLFTKKNEKQLEKYLDEIIRIESFAKNLNAIRLTELELQEWIQIVRRLGGDVRDLEMFHECMYFEDFLRRGKVAYTKGHSRKILPLGNLSPIPERDKLISTFIKEKYVLDKVLEEQERWIEVFGKGRWTQTEIDYSIEYFNDYINDINEYNKKNNGKNFIDIDKITIK
ncbi:hypothetical protein [Chryseobacterium sp.]|uniref:hypothetical protein n=1 Tax=Chryseobacterium sp. TaxID=1871047 RepID=UPI000EBDAD7D|nr:hypothetical protein [Chryseobacterium sp.]HCM32864.1 hypothetical protein [Chryseobacterium sp.]